MQSCHWIAGPASAGCLSSSWYVDMETATVLTTRHRLLAVRPLSADLRRLPCQFMWPFFVWSCCGCITWPGAPSRKPLGNFVFRVASPELKL